MRRAPVIVALLLAIALAFAAVAAAGAAALLGPLFGRVDTAFHPREGKVFVLAIGTDARNGNPDRSLADAIHVLGVNTKTRKGGVLNIPRDSWVPIPGYGHAKINEAVFHGGPELLVKTVENLTGIEIDYWVMVGFDGFQEIVRDLHGVEMQIHQSHNDTGASGSVLRAGRRNLKGYQALAYARARKSFRGGDIARTSHQGEMLIALLRKLRTEAADNPGSLFQWIATTKQNARTDIKADEMFRLGILATQMSATDIGNVTIPVSLGHVGAASVVHISPRAEDIYKNFKQTGSLR